MNELELHTQRRMEEAQNFFMEINGDFGEALLDYYIYLKMNEAQAKFGWIRMTDVECEQDNCQNNVDGLCSCEYLTMYKYNDSIKSCYCGDFDERRWI